MIVFKLSEIPQRLDLCLMVNLKYSPIVLFLISDASLLKVLNLNFWGLPWPMGVDKNYRIRALREELLIGDYDIVLLQAGTTYKLFHTRIL